MSIGTKDAKVLYFGAAPGFVAGVFQVNVVVPLDAPAGAAVPIQVTVGEASSPVGTTLAVK